MSKQNDWIIASINNPDFSPLDFKIVADMNLGNTLLLSRESYLKSKAITENPMFLKDGFFDEDKFNRFYANAVLKFGEFSTETRLDNFEYDMWDASRPKDAKVKDPNFLFAKLPNPDRISVGIGGINEVSESEYSRRELAQRSKIYDTKTGTFKDESVNDISFFKNPIKYIKSLFDEPLVYATYNEDGTHIDPFTKLEVKHYKGDWKLNEDGQYYTETLNGRSPIGKEVVSVGDYVTPENHFLNDYDFFDSDGIDKSVTGTIAKNLLVALPLIPFGPVGMSIYGGLFVGREMMKTLPTLYGMFQSFTGQEKRDSKLLNTLSAYGSQLSSSTSEYAKEHTFSAENFLNLAGDVALQWGLQRAVINAFRKLTTGGAKSIEGAYGKAAQRYLEQASNAFKDGLTGKLRGAKLVELAGGITPKEFLTLLQNGKWMETPFGKAAIAEHIPAAQTLLESRTRMGLDLSLVYMAMISNNDVYESTLEKEATPLEAAAITLGATIGMFSVDKYLGLGEMFFQKEPLRLSFRAGWKKEAEGLLETIKRETGVIEKAIDKKHLTGLISRSAERARKFVTDFHSGIKDRTLGVVGKSIGEGLEEVSEELVTDISKSMAELMGKLGYFSQEDYGAFEDPFERYMMSFLGGSIGGAMFGGVDIYQNRNNKSKIDLGENELVYLLRNHKKEDLIKELDALHKKGLLGSKELSWETAKGEDGNYYFLTADDNHMSLNDYIYNQLKTIYNQLDLIINNNKVGLSEELLFDNLVLSETRFNAFKDYFGQKSYATGYQEEFHKIAKELLDTDLAIRELENSIKDSTKSSDPLYQEKLNDLLAKKKDLQLKRDQFLSGEMSLHYVKKMLFAIDPKVSGLFMSMNKAQWARLNYGKSLEELSPAEQESLEKEYEAYQKDERMNLDLAFKVYENMEKKLIPEIESLSKLDAKSELDRFEKMMKKYPTNLYLTWNKKLDSETEESFKNRDTLLENESPELFKARLEQRKKAIDEYNHAHVTEFIKNFADMGLDNANYRLMHLVLNARRKDIENAIVEGFTAGLVDPNTGEIVKVDVETTNKIRNLLKSGKSLDLILTDLRAEFTETEKKEVGKKYKGRRDLDTAWEYMKMGLREGKYSDVKQLTIGQSIELVQDLINAMGSEEAFKSLSEDYGFNEQTLNLFKNLVNFKQLLENIKNLETQIKLLILNEITLNGGNIDKVSEETIQQEVNSRLGLELERLLQSLEQTYDIKVKDNIQLTLDLIEKLSSKTDEAILEINEKSIKEEIDNNVEELINNYTPAIEQKLNELQENTYIKAFDSLDTNLYKNNPTLLFFSRLTAKIGNVNVNVEDVLQELHLLYQEIDDFLNFRLTETLKSILEALKLNIDIAKAFIYAASKNTNANSPIGHNKAVNEFIKNHPKIFSSDLILPEISEDLGQLLLLELDSYEREINTWLNRAESNRVDKVSMFENADIALNKAIKKFYNTTKDSLVVKGVNLLEGYTSDLSNVEAERLLYNNVQQGIKDGKFTLEDIFNEVIPKIVTNIENIQYQIPSRLDDRLEYLNDYDKFTYFVTTISLPIDLYRATLKNFIETNENIVPISVLMYAGRIQQAMLTNSEYVNTALKWIYNLFKTKLPWLPNTTIVTGVGGAGKSEVLGRIATKNQGENAWVSGPKLSQIDNLITDKLVNAKGIKLNDIFEKILGSKQYAELNKDIDNKNKDGNFYTSITGVDNTTTYNLKNIKFLKVDNLPEIIIIDEITHIPNVKTQILAKFAEENGVHLILLGDTSQAGYSNGIMHNITKEEMFAWRTPKLYISLRDSTVLKYYNLQGVLEMLDPLIDSIGLVQLDLVMSNILINLLPKFNFRYHLDTELSGELITDKLDSKIIDIFKNNKDTTGNLKKVGFIGIDNSPILKQLKDAGVEIESFNTISDIQGQEFDYVVSDYNWNHDLDSPDASTLAKFLKELYTIISRSKKGTVIIDNHLSKKVKNKQDSLTGPATDVKIAIKQFRDKALAELAEIPTLLEEKPIVPPVSNEEDKINLNEETSGTITESEEEGEEVNEANEKQRKFEQNINFPVRCYTNVHTINANISLDENGQEVWTGNGSNKDISIFLKEGESIKVNAADSYIEKVLLLKSLLIYGDKYYDLADRRIHELFDKEAFSKAEYFISIEDISDLNKLMGLSNLKNENRNTYGDKLITLIAKIKGRDGSIYTLTLGGVANPDTWMKLPDAIDNNPNASEEDKVYAKLLRDNIIPNYKNILDKLILDGIDVPVDINSSNLTTLINKDGDGNPNPEIRLRDLESNRSPFDNKTKYAVRSKVYTLATKEGEDLPPGINKNLRGRPIMFVSSNVFLKPDDLMTLYLDLKNNGVEHGVRMIPLSNKGVAFKTLYRDKWRSLYTLQNLKNTMPFELLPMGVRMYISMWNFRANLLKFVNRLEEWKTNNNLSDLDVIDLIKADLDAYNQVVENNNGNYVNESDYRNSIQDKSKLQLLWDFNDSLADNIRQFRLGYDINNGVRIRTLTNINAANPFYAKQIASGNSIQGIYIMPNLANDYLQTLNVLFDKVINKIIPSDRDPEAYIDKDTVLDTNWYKSKIKDLVSLTVSGVDENGEVNESKIEFKNETAFKNIPMTMVLIAKYLEARAYRPQDFDEIYNDPEVTLEDKRFVIYTTDESGNKQALDYISIASTLGLRQTDPTGRYILGIGLKPYSTESESQIGTVDRRLDNLLSLMFHGLVELKNDNNFDNPSDLRATDADFKYGFFADPMAFVGTDNTFAAIATNEALFSTNLLPGFPIVTFQIKSENTITKAKPQEISKSLIGTNKLEILKLNVIDLSNQLGLNISSRKLNKINTEQELINFVNSLLNPIFALGENNNEISTIREGSIIYQYFTQSYANPINSLIDHIEIQNGVLVPIPIDLGIVITSEEWVDGVKMVTDNNGKLYKVLFDPKTGQITLDSLEKVELKGNSETNRIEPTFKNILFTILSYIDEMLNSIDNSFSRELLDLINELFNNANPELIPSDETLAQIVQNISERLNSEYDFDDIEGWNNAKNNLINNILSEITSEKRLREGCIN